MRTPNIGTSGRLRPVFQVWRRVHVKEDYVYKYIFSVVVIFEYSVVGRYM